MRGLETAVWWIDYSLHGQRYRESAHTKVKTEAQRLLRQKLTEREAGKVVGRPERVTFAQLRELAERQYVLDGRRSLDRLQGAFTHLECFFGKDARAPEITAARLDAYAAKRMAAGISRSTVNYELSALRRAFRLGIDKGLLATMPAIKLPRVHNARSGFFEDGDFAALLLELRGYLQPLIRFLHFTGWRRGEALSLTWDQVDWEGPGHPDRGDRHQGRRGAPVPLRPGTRVQAVARSTMGDARRVVRVSSERRAHRCGRAAVQVGARVSARGVGRSARARSQAFRRARPASGWRLRRRDHEAVRLAYSVDVRPLQHHRRAGPRAGRRPPLQWQSNGKHRGSRRSQRFGNFYLQHHLTG